MTRTIQTNILSEKDIESHNLESVMIYLGCHVFALGNERYAMREYERRGKKFYEVQQWYEVGEKVY